MAENEVVAASGEKKEAQKKLVKLQTAQGTIEGTKTEILKKHLQLIVRQVTGNKVSQDTAWDLFKAITHGVVELTSELEDHKISLAGVGTFEVLETKPRGSKAGLDKDKKPIPGATPWKFVPRYRFYPSSTIDMLLEQKLGLAKHNIEDKHYGLFSAATEPAPKPEKKPSKPTAPLTPAPKKPDDVRAEDFGEDDI